MKKKRKAQRKYWYFISETECVLCSRYSRERTRMYTPRPSDYNARHRLEQYACEAHF